MYITKLKNTSLYRNLLNNYIYIAFSIIILIIIINIWYLGIIYILYLYYIYKQNKCVMKSIIIIDLIFIILYIIFLFVYKDLNYTNYKGIVTSIKRMENSNKIEVTNFFNKIIIYDKNNTIVNIGDKVYVEGMNSKISGIHNQYAFDYQKYCMSKKIVSIINANRIEVSKSLNVYTLKKYIYKYIDYVFEDDLTQAYIKGFVFGDNLYFSEETNESLKINNISHLFAISGLHIGIIIKVLEKILNKTHLPKDKKENIICLALGIYLLLNYFNVSISRACFMYYLKIISKRYNLKLLNVDIISICFILFILNNPLIIYNISFKLSFIASFAIILYSETIKKTKIKNYQKIYQDIIMTIFIQILSLPIIINLNNGINIISPLLNVIFISLVSYVILPLSFVTFILPFFDNIYKYIINSFEYLNNLSSKLSLIKIENFKINLSIPSFSFLEAIVFYILLIFIIKYYKNIKFYIVIIIFMFCHINKVNLNIFGKVSFLSLQEGDAILIDLPFNKGVVMIDTGLENKNDVLDYLKASGVRKIDYLVLTHNHNDHNGKAKDIINSFNVNKIIISEYDNSEYNNFDNIIKLKKNDSFTLNGYKFEVLSPSEQSDDENDNSLVIKVRLGSYNYLFLGDASSKIEEKIEVDNIDVIKVGHHGSKTSSSSKFINLVNPKIAIITSGYSKKYKFPNEEVLNRLENIKTYRTDKNDAIYVYFHERFSIIKTIR